MNLGIVNSEVKLSLHALDLILFFLGCAYRCIYNWD